MILTLFFISFQIRSEMIDDITEVYRYGPETSDNDACDIALERAKQKALKKKGEHISSEDMMMCQESDDESECRKHTSIWSNTTGYIKDVGVSSREVGIDENSNFCKVIITVDVSYSTGKRDANFDFVLSLNKTIFNKGDSIEFTIEPYVELYIYIFSWAPEINANIYDTKVQLIFPNKDKKNLIKEKTTIPRNKQTSFKLTPLKSCKKSLCDEFIMVIATKEPINFQENYKLKDLKAKVSEIDLNNRREKTDVVYISN